MRFNKCVGIYEIDREIREWLQLFVNWFEVEVLHYILQGLFSVFEVPVMKIRFREIRQWRVPNTMPLCMVATWPWPLQVATFSDLATSWNYALHKGKLATIGLGGVAILVAMPWRMTVPMIQTFHPASSFSRGSELTSLQPRTMQTWWNPCFCS